jgi:porin
MYVARFLWISRMYLCASSPIRLSADDATSRTRSVRQAFVSNESKRTLVAYPRLRPICITATLLLSLAAGAPKFAYAQSTTNSPPVDSKSAVPAAADVTPEANTSADAKPAADAAADAKPAADAPAAAPTGFWDRSNLFGDMGGLRTLLGDRGVTLLLQETSEVFGNISGGVHRGVSYDGLTQFGVSVDMGKAFGLQGGQFFVDGLQIHGHGISTARLGVSQFVSSAEADANTRLWELWYQQSIGDKFDVKIGQQSLDQEFIISQYSTAFVNSTFGWPGLAAADLPAGGPVYPLSSLGVRLRLKATDSVTVLGGVFDGNPAPGVGDPQKLNSSGTTFNLHNGAMVIGEVQYAINQPPSNGSTRQSSGLPGTYKLGFWYNSNPFADLRLDQNGMPLAFTDGVPASHRGNFSVYAVADQMLWRPSPDGAKSIGVFARVMGSPSNRNLFDFSAQAGVVMKAPFKGRDNDSVGLAFSYAHVSSSASAFDRDMAATTPGYPVRSAETVIEATYQYQVTPWWTMQADLQYIFSPGGGIQNLGTGSRIGNEAVAGLRAVVSF